jgi:glycerol kinase
MEPAARGSLSGLSLSTTRAELAYAVLEGIAHSVVSSAEANETVAGVRTTEVVVGGGLAASDPLVQRQADLLGVSVRRMKDTHAASLRGAAFLAGSGGMLWPSPEAAAATLKTDRMFEPGLSDDERLERRRKWSLMIERELAMVDAERERSDR